MTIVKIRTEKSGPPCDFIEKAHRNERSEPLHFRYPMSATLAFPAANNADQKNFIAS